MSRVYSKVRVEFSELTDEAAGVYHLFVRESGTDGANNLGTDLAYALDDVPRQLLVLAQAVCVIYDRCKSKDKPPPLLRAAMDYVKRWEEYDKATAAGADPLSLEWPDATGSRP